MGKISTKWIVPLFIVGVVAGIFVRPYFYEDSPKIIRDTLKTVDWKYIEKPVISYEWYGDSIFLSLSDTSIIVKDSLVVLPRQYRSYEGEDYKAVVSGYDPVLESIEIRNQIQYIYQTIEDKNTLSLGVQAGIVPKFSPSIYASYSRKMGRFSATLQGGYDMSLQKGFLTLGAEWNFNF